MAYGFIYLWRDKKAGMFYLGSHFGSPDDGYVCGSKRMKRAYRKRPQDFRRRIIQHIEAENHVEVKAIEQRWLDLIPPGDVRHYNLSRRAHGADPALASEWMKGNTNSAGRVPTEKWRKAMTARFKGKPLSEEHKAKLKAARNRRSPHSQETKDKIGAAHRGRKNDNGAQISAGKIAAYAHRRELTGMGHDPATVAKISATKQAAAMRNLLNQMEWPV
jgi:hypothetical protein